MKVLFSFILIFSGITASQANSLSVESVLADYVTEYVQQYYPEDEYRFRVELRRLPNLLNEIPASDISGVRSNGRAPSGYAHFEAVIDNNKRNPQVNFQAFVEVEKLLPVANSRLESGSILSEDDFRMGWVDITRQAGNYASQLQNIQGKVAGRMIREGAPVRESELKQIPIIKAGESVRLIYNRSGFKIEMQAVAREDGAVGDKIRVHNERTRKTYIATVAPEGFLIWENTL